MKKKTDSLIHPLIHYSYKMEPSNKQPVAVSQDLHQQCKLAARRGNSAPTSGPVLFNWPCPLWCLHTNICYDVLFKNGSHVSHIHELVITSLYERCSHNFMGLKTNMLLMPGLKGGKKNLELTCGMQTDTTHATCGKWTLPFGAVFHMASLIG